VADPRRVTYVAQTTLSLDDGCARAIVEAMKQRFPDVRGPVLSDNCYATQNRQNAVRSLAAKIDVILVVGRAKQFQLCALAGSGRNERGKRLSDPGCGRDFPCPACA